MMVQHDTGRNGDEPYEGEDYDSHEGEYEAHEAEELEFADEDEALPWLDSDYEDDEGGYDTGRLVGFALLALLALALLIALIWWLSNRGPDPDLVADGSTIEAPEGPVKERPDDAGGKIHEGTGNVAPGVGQGQTTEGRLADETPKPSIDAVSSTDSADQASASGGVAVQVGAFSTRESAVAGWNTLRGQTAALQGVKYRVEQGKADIGTVYRLQAIAGDASAANKLCSALKSDGIACQVK